MRGDGKEVQGSEPVQYVFILFVIEGGSNSKRARRNLERLCEEWLPGRYRIDQVEVSRDFETALEYNILLTPSVVVKKPEPQIIIHGDLSDSGSFLDVLNLNREEKDGE